MLVFGALPEDEKSRIKLENLYTQFSRDMFKIAYRILNDYHLAQDAVQSAFINIFGNITKIDKINCNRTRNYVLIITRNISINLYRMRNKQNDITLDDIDEFLSDKSETVEDRIINEEAFYQIIVRLKEIHPTYADIISLKYFYQYSDKKIGKLLNISQENVRVRLYRARKSLIKLL